MNCPIFFLLMLALGMQFMKKHYGICVSICFYSQSQPFGKHAFCPPSGPEAFNLFDQHD